MCWGWVNWSLWLVMHDATTLHERECSWCTCVLVNHTFSGSTSPVSRYSWFSPYLWKFRHLKLHFIRWRILLWIPQHSWDSSNVSKTPWTYIHTYMLPHCPQYSHPCSHYPSPWRPPYPAPLQTYASMCITGQLRWQEMALISDYFSPHPCVCTKMCINGHLDQQQLYLISSLDSSVSIPPSSLTYVTLICIGTPLYW